MKMFMEWMRQVSSRVLALKNVSMEIQKKLFSIRKEVEDERISPLLQPSVLMEQQQFLQLLSTNRRPFTPHGSRTIL